jgi:uncharacterized protein
MLPHKAIMLYMLGMPDSASSPVIPCAICGKPRVEKFRPFCSKRCADVDLNRWLKGIYAVPVTENDDEDGDKAEDQPGQDRS